MTAQFSLARRLKAGETVHTGWCPLPYPIVAETLGREGFPAVTLDQQHGLWDTAGTVTGIAAVRQAGAAPIVRIPVGAFSVASRVLDMGAEGVIAPMINTAADALAFVSVAREGIETSLFLYASSGTDSPGATLAGGVAGLLCAVVLGVLVYHGAAHLNLGTFFRVTSVALLVFAAYLLAGAMHELGELAGNEALENASYAIGLLYVAGTVWLYLRPPAVLHRALGR